MSAAARAGHAAVPTTAYSPQHGITGIATCRPEIVRVVWVAQRVIPVCPIE